MRNLITALMIPAVCMTLAADSTGRISGKVLGKDGKPVPGVVIIISRTDINWTKELKTSDKGTFMQVGLEPKDFKFTVSAPGYHPFKEELHIPLGDTLIKNITLLTEQEAGAEALKASGGVAAVKAPVDDKTMTGTAAYNAGVEAYNQQKFADALPFLEKAVTDLKEALPAMKEGDARKAVETQVPVAERVYGICLFEVGKADEGRRDLIVKAGPYLAAAYEKNPKDQRLLVDLVEVAKVNHDDAAQQKYQAALDTLIGPRPELAYNNGVTAFNDGKYKEAKEYVNKAIAMDPKFADSYWLLGVVSFGLNDIKGAKEAFKKYMEIAPTGKKAGEVKEFLKELK